LPLRTDALSSHDIERNRGLKDRIEIFEEIDVGAAILELKMLGAPYAASYAFAGTNQIAHYMDSKDVRLGFLVIFDARARDFGAGLKPLEMVGNCTVRVTFVDVRPDVVRPAPTK
jgi:hypothetical protein